MKRILAPLLVAACILASGCSAAQVTLGTGVSLGVGTTITVSSGGTVATPAASPAAGTYGSAQSVTLSTTTSGAALYYSTSSTATCSSTLYTGAIAVSASETISAIGCLSGYTSSANLTAAYTIYPVTIPGDATAYTSLEQQSGWTTDASSDISPNPPTSYAIVPTGGGGSTMTLETANTNDDYAGWMAKKGISNSAGLLNMVVRASFTFNSVSGIQAWEVGRRATNAAGITDNGQTQLVPISGSLLEFDKVPSSSGGWLDTTCRFPTFVVGTTYNEELYYVNDSSGDLSLEYVELNGTVCIIPSSMNPVAGAAIGFAPSEAVVAFQPDIKPNGAAYNAVVTYSAWAW